MGEEAEHGCSAIRLDQVLLGPLGPGGSLDFQRAVFDYRRDQPVDARIERADPDSVLVFDGVFLLRHELRERWDFSIFLRVDFMTALARGKLRDAHSMSGANEVVERYSKRYLPGQRLYLSEAQPEAFASVVVDNS